MFLWMASRHNLRLYAIRTWEWVPPRFMMYVMAHNIAETFKLMETLSHCSELQ